MKPMPAAQPATQPAGQYLTFFLSEAEYAVDILRVREIIAYGTVTRVPQTPDFVRGMLNHRGTVVPVLDLAVKLGLPPASATPRTCILLIEVPSGEGLDLLGIVADDVHQVIEFAPGDIAPPPSFGTVARPDCLLGLGRMGMKFALILDLDRVLDSPASYAPPQGGSAPALQGGERR
jgi:purine-binding chemotaxis protein CheW